MAPRSTTDEFGFRIGSNRAKAAAMFKRGASQAEIEAATGYTQYNTLKAAERRGHKVSKIGTKYYLEKYYLETAESSSGAGTQAADKLHFAKDAASSAAHRFGRRVVWVKVGPGGRIVVPAAYREAIGLREGDDVQVRIEGDEVRILSRAAAIRRAQDLVAKYVPPGVSLVDELIAERRREAAREEAGE